MVQSKPDDVIGPWCIYLLYHVYNALGGTKQLVLFICIAVVFCVSHICSCNGVYLYCLLYRLSLLYSVMLYLLYFAVLCLWLLMYCILLCNWAFSKPREAGCFITLPYADDSCAIAANKRTHQNRINIINDTISSVGMMLEKSECHPLLEQKFQGQLPNTYQY